MAIFLEGKVIYMTNEYVKNQILIYQNCIDNKVLNDTNYDGLLKLLRQDIKKLKEKENQNTLTKISLLECEKYLKEDKVDFSIIVNSTLKIFFDYYIANMSETVEDEIFDLITEFFNFFLNRSMIYNQLTVLNLRPVTICNDKNHEDGYYHLIYQRLLGTEEVYEMSEIVQDESFRQYCNTLCRVLILNNKFDYLIEFYSKANRIIEPKVLIESFIELKEGIDEKYFNYNLCNFLSQLFDKLDFSFYENYVDRRTQKVNTLDESFELNSKLLKKNKRTGVNITRIFDKIFDEICEFYSELSQDEILFNDFYKYTDDLYCYDKEKTIKEEKKAVFHTVNEWFISFKNESVRWRSLCSLLSILLAQINKIYPEDDKQVDFSANIAKFSTTCFFYIEHIIDYLIDLRKKESDKFEELLVSRTTDILKEAKRISEMELCEKRILELDKKIYRLMNLYIRAKNINQKVISEDEKNTVEFKDYIEKRLNVLQDIFVSRNKYLAMNLSGEEKQNIVKSFLKSAFQSYKVNGVERNAKEEYNIRDLSERDIDLCYDAIKNNQSLIDQIVSGEKLVEPYVCAREMGYDNGGDDYASGDYTNLVVCQIKGIERYVKEVLVQYHRGNIWKTQKGRVFNDDRWPIVNRQDGNSAHITLGGIQNPTAEDLKDLECGSAIYALFRAYIEDRNLGVINFKISKQVLTEFVQKVRNGHLHINKIKTMNEALMRRNQTAFWLMHLIKRLGEKGILNR